MFDKAVLQADLDILPRPHRIAFAASCTERLLPEYLAFTIVEHWGDFEVLRQALDLVWQHVLGSLLDSSRLQALIDQCAEQAPHADKFPSYFSGLARHAVEAICSTLECCIDGDASHAAAAGEQPTESLDMYLDWVGSPYLDGREEVGLFRGIDEVTRSTEFAPQGSDQMTVELQRRQNELFAWIEQSPLMLEELERQRQEIEFLRRHPQLDAEAISVLQLNARRGGIRLQARELVR